MPLKWTPPHAVLGVPENATHEQIRKSYLELVRKHPPDRDPDMFQKVENAYSVLTSEEKRVERLTLESIPVKMLDEFFSQVEEPAGFSGPGLWLEALK